MPRIRTLKPEHRQHRKVGRLSDREYRLWVGLILEADDEGRLVEDLGALRLAVFGYHHNVTEQQVDAALAALDSLGLIRRYIVEPSTNLIDLPSWHDHQRIDRPRPSLLQPYDTSSSIRRTFDESSPTPRADLIGSDRIGKDRKGTSGLGAEAPSPPAREFPIPDDIETALRRCPVLSQARGLHNPGWWRAEIRANNSHRIDYPAELLKAEAWLTTNPARAPRKDFPRFMHAWFARAGERNGGPHGD